MGGADVIEVVQNDHVAPVTPKAVYHRRGGDQTAQLCQQMLRREREKGGWGVR